MPGGKGWLAALCALGAVRVLAAASVFPLFCNVDEPFHYDMVVKASRGRLSAGFEPVTAEAARVIAESASWEYLNDPGPGTPREYLEPAWRLPAPARKRITGAGVRQWTGVVNGESLEPPGYYLPAGVWLAAGERIGFGGARGAYWVRWLGAVALAGTILFAGVAVRGPFAGRPAVRLGVPIILAAWPQDLFYSINNGVPMAFWGAAGFMLMAWGLGRRRWLAACAGGGFCLGLAVLSSYAAAPAVAALVLMPWLAGLRPRRRALARTAVAAAFAALPVALWLIRNVLVAGVLTGAGAKAAAIGLTRQPLAAALDHPVFTLEGAFTFIRFLSATFWRGEFTWHGRPMEWPLLESVMLAVCVAGIAAVLLRGREAPGPARGIELAGAAAAVLGVVYLGALSVSFDFSTTFFPSRAFPFIANGRLLTAAVAPLVVAVLAGLDRLVPRRIPPWARVGAVAGLAVWLAAADLLDWREAAGSPYNWFHLP